MLLNCSIQTRLSLLAMASQAVLGFLPCLPSVLTRVARHQVCLSLVFTVRLLRLGPHHLPDKARIPPVSGSDDTSSQALPRSGQRISALQPPSRPFNRQSASTAGTPANRRDFRPSVACVRSPQHKKRTPSSDQTKVNGAHGRVDHPWTRQCQSPLSAFDCEGGGMAGWRDVHSGPRRDDFHFTK
ncbi:hypothetical protein DFH07DRAFT_846334 [Mycena maculata]|uniref:Uncharacterized protein n=1 Tax=Mycena maculata TaxID=230809 RepID=A0AAD7I1R1_9AGAR|nr:hypothetical protein DFH07DRAFT_846334 [Mycena maculata]